MDGSLAKMNVSRQDSVTYQDFTKQISVLKILSHIHPPLHINI